MTTQPSGPHRNEPTGARRLLILSACALAVGACSTLGSVDEAEIGRIAAVNLATSLEASAAMRQGRLEAAASTMDASLHRDLSYLIITYPRASADPTFLRQAHRTVRSLKRYWLQYPPELLDHDAIAFIERVCRSAGDCPREELKAKR